MPSGDHFMQQRRDAVRTFAVRTGTPLPTVEPEPAPLGLEVFRTVAFETHPEIDDVRLRGLTEHPWFRRATELMENVDLTYCWRCGVGVGWSTGDGLEPTTWTTAVLVDGPGEDPVSIQCEECAPGTCAQPWPAGQPAGWLAMRPDHCWTAPDGFTRVHVHDPGGTACRCGGTELRRPPEPAQ